MELNEKFFDFNGFTQPEINKKPEPKKRKSRAKSKNKTTKSKEDDMYSYGKRNKLVDYQLPHLTDVLRLHFINYYKLAINSDYAHKYKESVRIAEKIIHEYITENDNEVTRVISSANQVRHTMSHKGWNLTFKGNTIRLINFNDYVNTEPSESIVSIVDGEEVYERVVDISISIMCIFKPNYTSKYTIIAWLGDTQFSIFNDMVTCEKTIVSFPDDIPQI